MNKLKIFVLSSIVLFPDFYFIHPSIRLPMVAMALLVSVFVIKSGIPNVSFISKNPLDRLIWIFLLFVLYMSIVDYIRGDTLYEAIVKFCSYVVVVMILPAFISGGATFPMLRWYRRLAVVTICFALLQFLGMHVALPDIVPDLIIVGSDKTREILIDDYGRATGATYNTIAFAIQMVALINFGYGGYLVRRSNIIMKNVALGTVGLFLSQTRAALFSLLPSLMISHILYSKSKIRTVVKMVPAIIVAVAGGFMVAEVITSLFPYLAKEIDEGDTHRLWTNYYMTIGVLNESPFFGIDPKDAWNIYFRYADEWAPVQYTGEMNTPTHHNQLGFYFRYYGLVGLVFLFIIYLNIFKIIGRSGSYAMRIVLSSIFILDFAYSMTHNNKLIGSPLLWIFLSLSFLSARDADQKLINDIGSPK